MEGEEIGRSYAHEHGVEVLTLRHVFTPSPRQLVELWRAGGKQQGRYIHYSYVEATDQARALGWQSRPNITAMRRSSSLPTIRAPLSRYLASFPVFVPRLATRLPN